MIDSSRRLYKCRVKRPWDAAPSARNSTSVEFIKSEFFKDLLIDRSSAD